MLRARGDEIVAPHIDELDLTDPDAVEAYWDALPRAPRWLVNAAGGYRTGTLAESTPDDVRFLAGINVATAWWSCRAGARRLPEGGAIVNVAARAGQTGGKGSAAYAVSKAAVIRLTEVLALELSPRVRVNAVVPALIATPANAAQGIDGGTSPAEIAEVIAYLLSDEASAVTGALVPV
jgi:NAD(P)-dependent dehydrogenase (short-subunit alcohol dehydrogenase family)